MATTFLAAAWQASDSPRPASTDPDPSHKSATSSHPWPDPCPPSPAQAFARASIPGTSNIAARRMRNHRIGRAAHADQPRQRAGIDARNADAAIRLHPRIKMLCSCGNSTGRSHPAAQSRPSACGFSASTSSGLAPTLPICGKGEVDDLPGIRGIGHHLLISGHRGVEADFAHRLALCAKAPAPDDFARRQYQYACRSGGRARRGGVGHVGRSRRGCNDVVKRQPLKSDAMPQASIY